MALWKLVKSGRNRSLIYHNDITGVEYDCGAIHSSVDSAGVVEWIVRHGDPNRGDRIEFENGSSVYVIGSIQEKATDETRPTYD